MKTQINPYLTFNGNCRNAMTFYQKCLGGKLYLQTIGDSPISASLPPEMKSYILHATLTKGSLIIMASDMVDEEKLVKGNAVSLMLNCSNEKELRSYYTKLSTGGEATYPIEETYWGALFGGLTDKFGNYWLLRFNKDC